MKTLLTLSAFLLLSLVGISCSTPPIEQTESRTVYICTSPKAYAYHTKKDCYNLNRCSYEIVKTTEDAAKENGYRKCQGGCK